MSTHDPTDPIYRAATIIEAYRQGHARLDSWEIVGKLIEDDLLLTQEVKAMRPTLKELLLDMSGQNRESEMNR